MNKNHAEVGQWVHHTSGVLGKIVWVDPDPNSQTIQVNWKYSMFGPVDTFVSSAEVILYVGNMTSTNSTCMKIPGATTEFIPVPPISYLVTYPAEMNPAMIQLLTMNANDLGKLAERFFTSLTMCSNLIEPPESHVLQNAWVIHRAMLAILLHGKPTLEENIQLHISEVGLVDIIERYK